jgi:dihydropteroate synthase
LLCSNPAFFIDQNYPNWTSKIHQLEKAYTINIAGQLHDLSIPRIMGILNITPDSFYSKSRMPTVEEAVSRASQMIMDGAWSLDIGGYSSRPGSKDVPADTEIRRVVGPISAIREKYPNLPISIDTFRSNVARAAIEAGANMVNDISGGHLDSHMLDFVAEANVPFIAMHMRGTPQEMKKLVEYDDLISEMIKYFSEIKRNANKRGVSDVIIDPGFGFAKTLDHNFQIIKHLEDFHLLDCPMLIGVSRKSMIFKHLDISPSEALNGTTVLNTVALLKGANILRVHDVTQAQEAIHLVQKIADSL